MAFEPKTYRIGDKDFVSRNPYEDFQYQVYQNLARQQDAGERALGKRDRPEYQSIIDPNTGRLMSQYSISGYADQVMGDDKGFNKFEQEALRDGPSSYAKTMLEMQQLDRDSQLDDINSQYNMGVQTAMDRIASQGGAMSGAGERIGASSIRDMLASRQGARRDFNRNRLGIMAEDERNRIGQLQALSGMEMDRNRLGLQSREFDINNTLQERQFQRQDEMDAWKINEENWRTGYQAAKQGQAANACFPKGTKIVMADGSEKNIEDIKLGEEVEGGGEVYKIITGLAGDCMWFDYEGVTVTGGHVVFDLTGEWRRVEDCEHAKPLPDFKTKYLYNLATVDHELVIGEIIFSDADEVDDQRLSWDESLELKNKGIYV